MKFFKGMMIGLPLGLLLWVGIFYAGCAVVHRLF